MGLERAASPEDLPDVSRRLKEALELQMMIRGEELPAVASVSRVRAAPVDRAAPPPAPPVPDSRPAPAAPVTPGPDVQIPSWQRNPSDFDSLGELHDAYANCQRCPLGDARTNFVFGVGSPQADVMFIGEAPGRDEDLQGEPFVGKAGQLLNKILAAIDLQREDVYIANILKCRPPGNRDPQPTEIASCEPILARQIEVIRPVVLCTLGAFAARTMLGVTTGISRLRGRVHDYRGIPLVPTYHPAALLRNPSWKRPTWEDVQLLRREYDARQETP